MIDVDIARAAIRGSIMTDPGIKNASVFLAQLPVRFLVVRAYPVRYGTMDDDGFLFDGEDLLWSGKVNADPGRTGLNKVLGLDYARLVNGVWIEVPGRHKLKARQFIQPRESSAAALGLPELFLPTDVHQRYRGFCTIERMRDATTVSKRQTGRFGINLHESGSDREDKTGSAGCLTAPNQRYRVFRDLAYRAMGTETGSPRQKVLPVVIATLPFTSSR